MTVRLAVDFARADQALQAFFLKGRDWRRPSHTPSGDHGLGGVGAACSSRPEMAVYRGPVTDDT
jgi:hypothetical protein